MGPKGKKKARTQVAILRRYEHSDEADQHGGAESGAESEVESDFEDNASTQANPTSFEKSKRALVVGGDAKSVPAKGIKTGGGVQDRKAVYSSDQDKQAILVQQDQEQRQQQELHSQQEKSSKLHFSDVLKAVQNFKSPHGSKAPAFHGVGKRAKTELVEQMARLQMASLGAYDGKYDEGMGETEDTVKADLAVLVSLMFNVPMI
jgi:hypothetical protein